MKTKTFTIWNGTDNIPATFHNYSSKEEAEQAVKSLRERYKAQGYYRDNNWNKISPEDINYVIVEN
jgi:hypothetical protein